MRSGSKTAFTLAALAILVFQSAHGRAQAALLMEEPYGFFGAVNPTGHTAIYFDRICAETPVKLRRCEPGEMGAVISRYEGIAGYDWIAIPLIPYLYSVENASQVPAHVDRQIVSRMRNRYHEAHLLSLGDNLRSGDFLHGGWSELVGVAYERRIYAFRFETSEAQDDALIARLNAAPNRSNFDLLYSNCADFARIILNSYFPGTFRRSVFPDAGMTTPKQIAFKLVRHSGKLPEAHLAVFEIPQIPGYRAHSRTNKSVAGALATTAYAVPIALVNPYVAGGLAVDYLMRGRFHLLIKHPQVLTPGNMSALTASTGAAQNPESAVVQAPSAAALGPAATQTPVTANFGLEEIKDTHE